MDDHSGYTLPIIVFLKTVEVKMPALQQSSTTTFRTAQERKVQKPAPKVPPVRRYVVPDVQVGDTVRVVGRVDQWTRPKWSGPEVIRQVAVDLVSDGGSISELKMRHNKLTSETVWPDELYEHVALVRELHRTLYSQPFTVSRPPASLPPTPSLPSPSKSILSSIAPSEYGYEDEPDDERPLRHPFRLSSSRHTDATFKYYLQDHVGRETKRAIRSALQLSAETQGNSVLHQDEYVPALAERFPEYREAMRPTQTQTCRALPGALTCSTSFNTPLAKCVNDTPKAGIRTRVGELETPSKSSYARADRERGLGNRKDPIVPERPARTRRSGTQADPIILSSPPQTPERSPAFRSRAERDRDRGMRRSTRRPDPGSPTPTRRRCTQEPPASLDCSRFGTPAPELPVFTVESLMKEETLAILAPLVVTRRAKKDEAAMREREANGTLTERDRRKIQARLDKGRSKGHWKLDKAEMAVKVRNLVTWAIRAIMEDGGLICIPAPSGAKAESYLPVRVELLAPLITPLVQRERARLSNVFRSKTERQRGVNLEADIVSNVSRELKKWGDGRYERVGDWAVGEAYEWGRSRGLY